MSRDSTVSDLPIGAIVAGVVILSVIGAIFAQNNATGVLVFGFIVFVLIGMVVILWNLILGDHSD
jgi:hypothetical protein